MNLWLQYFIFYLVVPAIFLKFLANIGIRSWLRHYILSTNVVTAGLKAAFGVVLASMIIFAGWLGSVRLLAGAAVCAVLYACALAYYTYERELVRTERAPYRMLVTGGSGGVIMRTMIDRNTYHRPVTEREVVE